MIKFNKASRPQVLIDNFAEWTNELDSEIKIHGSFNKLPDKIKETVRSRYRHPDIESELIPNEDTKCVFCESIPAESGYVEIEHFSPKTLYPSKTYLWENLLPSCKRCNLAKLSLDTEKSPLVKPDIEEPKDFFEYDSIKIKVKKNALDLNKASRTISTLKLNQHRLIKPRSELLVRLVNFENVLGESLKEYKKATYKNKKNRIVCNIANALDQIDSLSGNQEKYAGFTQHYINNNAIIQEAKKLIQGVIQQQVNPKE